MHTVYMKFKFNGQLNTFSFLKIVLLFRRLSLFLSVPLCPSLSMIGIIIITYLSFCKALEPLGPETFLLMLAIWEGGMEAGEAY